ncbi:hypothetical protein QTI33_31840 [Variovorax sp. J22P271]|uniref:KfrB domain-containing protein n=1 Tax=Variovorax davisae TaxID=3053515 RepID=UPI002578F4BF|nr:hypothetical protein [Variovorax sp. J22P271]MDM0036765.1 hypothetical protein [Variovorax sp. J22P271]
MAESQSASLATGRSADWNAGSRRIEELLSIEPNRLSPSQAKDLLQEDLARLQTFDTPDLRSMYASAIGDIAETFPSYRAELQQQSPEIVAEIEAAVALDQAKSNLKEDRKAAELERMVSEKWTVIESVPDALMRANFEGRGVEINEDGQRVTLHGLAEIERWSEDHHASAVDKERLVSLGIQASRGRPTAEPQPVNFREYQQMEAAAQQPQADVKRIGANMPKPDWQMSIDLLKAYAPGERGKVYIPKAGAEYGGQVMLVTDSHIVQRVGRGTAIAHDLSKLENGQALASDIDSGKLKRGMHMKVQYGQETGLANVIPFNQQRASEINRDLTAWAEKNITNAKGRETFLKHVAAATKELGQAPAAPQRAAPAPAPQRSMQRDR